MINSPSGAVELTCDNYNVISSPVTHVNIISETVETITKTAQTLLDLRSCYVLEGRAPVDFCWGQDRLYVWSTVYADVHIREFSLQPQSNTMEPGRTQHDRSAACSIAQEYPSITVLSLPQETF